MKEYLKYHNFIISLKSWVVCHQKYELAAQLRDIEVSLFLKRNTDTKSKDRFILDEEKCQNIDKEKLIRSLLKIGDVELRRELRLRLIFEDSIFGDFHISSDFDSESES